MTGPTTFHAADLADDARFFPCAARTARGVSYWQETVKDDD